VNPSRRGSISKSDATMIAKSTRTIGSCMWALLCCGVLVFAQSSAAAPLDTQSFVDPTSGSKFVGADTCKTCHSDLYEKNFANTAHAALLKDGKHGCEDCHGAGSAHVEAGGDKTKIIRFSQLSPAEASHRA